MPPRVVRKGAPKTPQKEGATVSASPARRSQAEPDKPVGDLTKADRYRGKAGNIANFVIERDSDIGARPVGNFATIRVEAVGLNFADVFACTGLYSATPLGVFTPGLEYAGVIEEVNEQVKGFKPGDRVLGVTRFGGYTTRIHADLRYVRHIPEGWSFAQAAALPAQAITAWYGMVELGALKKGDTVLVQSAAGGTGLWVAKICLMFGANVVATVGSAGKVKELMRLVPQLKRHDIIDRSECRTTNSIRVALRTALSAKGLLGFDLAFDTLMGDWYGPTDEFLSPMGRHIVLGAGSMTPHSSTVNWIEMAYKYLKRPRLDPLQMMSDNKSCMAFNLIWLYEKYELLDRLVSDLMGSLHLLGPPVVGHIFNFEDLQSAIHLFQSGTTIGKVVLEVVRPAE